MTKRWVYCFECWRWNIGRQVCEDQNSVEQKL